MAQVVALAMPGGEVFVDALRRTWDDGDAAAPVDPRLPPSAQAAALDAVAATAVIGPDGTRTARPQGRGTEAGDALVVTTSGTSGAPKGVVLTHDAVAASARATSARLGVVPDRHRWLACLPLNHVGGLSVVTRALLTGTPVDIHPGFDADAVTAAASDRTMVSLVATALGRVDPSRFHTVLLGGGPPPAERPDNVVTTYGMTETGSGIVYDGIPLAGVSVRLAPDGTIAVRGPTLLRAYRDEVDPKDADGWFHTGDLGHWEGDRLVVDGRCDDLIITGGENVWPAPVEALLRQRPEVAEVAVVGHPDPEWGQRVVAHVVTAAGCEPPNLDGLRATVTDHLGPWHAPRQLVVHRSLPRTVSGKVRRTRLLDEA